MLFLVSMGKTGLSHDIFFEFSVGPFEVVDCIISRSQPQKFDLDFHSTSMTSKGLTENSKKMSWDNPVFPIDTKNTIGFFVQFFLS